MKSPHLDTILLGRPGLIVHVGAGADGPGALLQSARSAILIEPHPDRAARLRASCASLPSVRLIEAAVGREAGQASLHHPSHTQMDRPGGAGGAQGLALSLAATFDASVDCIAAQDILTQDDFDGEGENILLIDAVDDALVVLDALDVAGWLVRFDHVVVQVSDSARYPGAPARADIEAWARAQDRLMLALPGQSGPDVWRAWISPPRPGAHTQGPADAGPPQGARAQALEAALETYRSAAKEAEARWLEQRSALLGELRASQARCAELEAGAVQSGAEPDADLDSVRREAAEADARNRTLREELMAELQASRARGVELGRALQHAETARARAEEELEAARRDREAAGEPAPQEPADRGEAARLQGELDRLQDAVRAGAERERALTGQLNAAREDLRQAITEQHSAQAALAELQTRYGALLDDRNALDGLLRQLADRLTGAPKARHGVDREAAQTDRDG